MYEQNLAEIEQVDDSIKPARKPKDKHFLEPDDKDESVTSSNGWSASTSDDDCLCDDSESDDVNQMQAAIAAKNAKS